MERAPHRIRRQRWLVRTGSAAEAFALRQRLRDSWQPALLPELERAFDTWAPPDEVIRIPRLVLHVRLAPGEDPIARMPELISRALEEQLQKTESEPRATGHDPVAETRVSATDDSRDGLVAYLGSGVLRWHDAGAAPAEVRTRLRVTAQQHLHDIASSLRAMSEPAPVIARLVQLFSIEDWDEIADAMLSALPAARRDIALALVRVITSGGRETEDRSGRGAVARVLAAALHGPTAAGADDLLALAGRLAPEIARGPTSAPCSPATSPQEAAKRSAPARSSREFPDSRLAAPPPARAARRESPDRDTVYPLSVPYAGLILLHPFLPRLFAATGVIPEGARAPTPLHLPRAASLLHHLAAGPEADPCDFELPFIHVLLGLAPDAPLPGVPSLTGVDLAEADNLLHSVIAHWSALKSTSVAGLRQSFLQRPGLLHDAYDGWRLHVERGPFDVLIDRLPWALGTVKLPWMPRPIHTEW